MLCRKELGFGSPTLHPIKRKWNSHTLLIGMFRIFQLFTRLTWMKASVSHPHLVFCTYVTFLSLLIHRIAKDLMSQSLECFANSNSFSLFLRHNLVRWPYSHLLPVSVPVVLKITGMYLYSKSK